MGNHTIIVGAGSAGCVLAGRLSEDPARSVLLVEAGPDYADAASLPPDIANAEFPAYSHDWGYYSAPDAQGRIIHLPRGRLVGGCGATNAAFALRGTPSDYDEWAALGNSGWSFDQVLPFFRRLEDDLDFHDDWHGSGGPLPIRRFTLEELAPVQRTFLEACATAGYRRVDDLNAPGALGAGPVPFNALAGVRQSTALTYLAQARRRPNLAIRPHSAVDCVLLDGRRAVGIRTANPPETLLGDSVILAAGTYGSPAILMRSGLGPADHLRNVGIAVVEDLGGVGRNLIDHPLFGLRFAAEPGAGADSHPLCQVLLALKSADDIPGHDLAIFPTAIFDAGPDVSPTGAFQMLFVALVKPRSRGRLLLHSADPGDAPIIHLNYFEHPADMPRMLKGVRLARELAHTRPLGDLLGPELPARPGAAEVGVAAASLEEVVMAGMETFHHAVGTCRMGPEGDAHAVVDQQGRVRGVAGLSVVDASIIPAIPSVPTHLTTIMLAERCAEWIKESQA